MQPFFTQLRVRHHEMDALGHVNNAVYQHYLEQAAVEHSESLGFSLKECQALGGVFVLRRIEIDYLRPAVAGDRLEVKTWLHELRGTRTIRRYEIRKTGEEERLVAAEALWVWIDLKTGRPRPIPEAIFSAYSDLQQAPVEEAVS